MTLMSIDPGGTSGVAYRIDGVIYTCTYTEPSELYKCIARFSHVLKNIVYENFQAETIGKHGLHTVRIVGGIQALCAVYDIEMTQHIPQHRYPFQQDAKQLLKSKGIRFVIHEEDALAHLLRWEYDRQSK